MSKKCEHIFEKRSISQIDFEVLFRFCRFSKFWFARCGQVAVGQPEFPECSVVVKRRSARIPTYLNIHCLRQNFRFWICLGHLKAYTKLLWKPKYQSFWLIYKKMVLTPFFQVLNSGPKNRLFQCWLYFAIFFFIVWRFGARNVSNARESFSL